MENIVNIFLLITGSWVRAPARSPTIPYKHHPKRDARGTWGLSAINIFFTADRHFGHISIIELAGRPFSSVAEMDEIMIERHNKVVRPGDIVHDLGDFAFADHDPYLRRLNGQMYLTLGNHDHSKRVRAAEHLWASIESLRNITPARRHPSDALPRRPPRVVEVTPRRDPPLRP